MIGESLAIVTIILVMAVMYRRAGKKDMALLALPLICVPCGRLIGIGVLGTAAGVKASVYSYAFIVGGLVAAVAWSTILSMGMGSRSIKLWYLVLNFAFSGALLIAYLIR